MLDFIFFVWQQPTPPQGGGSPLTTILFILAAIVVIYLMMIRPQNQQRKKQNSFTNSIKKGSKIVTVGGIHGTITDVREKEVDLIIAPKTVITIQKESISMEMSNTVYASEESEKK